jgi:S1-C subfamily serine protease
MRSALDRRQAIIIHILVAIALGLGLFYHQPWALADAGSAPDFAAVKERAEHGSADAQWALGGMYYDGQGVARDLRQALKWFLLAANQGNPLAQYNLGLMYEQGIGTARNPQEALYWYTQAALHDNAAAQQNLGVMYANGQGVPRNYLFAFVWSTMAAEHGQASAIRNRATAARYLSPAELIRGQELIAKLRNRIAHPQAGPPQGSKASPSSPSSNADAIEPPASRAKGHRAKGSGSGFIITTDGYLMTCHHVIEGGRAISVIVNRREYPAKVIRDDKANDLALLKIEGTFQALAFAGQPSAKLGQEVFTIGYPDPLLQGISAKFTKGEISSLAGMRDNPKLYQISVPVQPGNSGGPLIDMHGNVTGVIEAMLDAKTAFAVSGSLPQSVNYAIKSTYARGLAASLPEVAAKLLPPAGEGAYDQVVDKVSKGAVMVLVYD